MSYNTEAEHLIDVGPDPSDALQQGRRVARAAFEDNPELWDLHLVEGQLDLAAIEWALDHGGAVDDFLTNAGRRIAETEELNPTAPAIFLRRAEASLLAGRWDLSRGETRAFSSSPARRR